MGFAQEKPEQVVLRSLDLARAIESGDMECFMQLLEAGESQHAFHSHNEDNMLTVAIVNGQVAMAAHLRALGAQEQELGADAHVELMATVLRGDPETAQRMIDEQQIALGGEKSDRLLRVALSKGQFKFADYLLAQLKKGDLSQEALEKLVEQSMYAKNEAMTLALMDLGYEMKSHHARWSLMYASSSGMLDVIRKLVGSGVDVNAELDRKVSPLHLAMMRDQEEAVALLIELGADPYLKTTRHTPMRYAVMEGKIRMVSLLKQEIAPRQSRAISAPRNDSDSSRQNLLQAAAFKRMDWMRQYLLWGADIKVEDADGNNVLMLIVPSNSVDDIRFLLERGALIDHCNKRGETALLASLLNGCWDAARCLINAGADVNKGNQYGTTPLAHAIVRDQEELVALLLEKGAKPTSGALCAAVKMGDRKLIELFIQQGVDVNAADPFGGIPLEIALRDEREDIAAYLRSQGAKDKE